MAVPTDSFESLTLLLSAWTASFTTADDPGLRECVVASGTFIIAPVLGFFRLAFEIGGQWVGSGLPSWIPQ